MNDRYSRQIMLPHIGPEGQEKLARASVFVAGAGGLGSPILTYLAAAGVGRIGFIDSDTVSPSNLNRQFLHNSGDIGRAKADSAREKLRGLNDEIIINACNEHISAHNAQPIFSGYDMVLGAVDSFETRFVINRACVNLGIPYIDGGVNGFSGCVFFLHPPQTPCLNCVFPEKPASQEAAGILGVTAGVIGTIQANIALLWLLGLPNHARNKIVVYDGLRLSIDTIDIRRDAQCPVCGTPGLGAF